MNHLLDTFACWEGNRRDEQMNSPSVPRVVLSANITRACRRGVGLEGAGDFADVAQLKNTHSGHVELQTTHVFSKAGTYFPAVRVSSHRDGNPDTPYARMPNLDRVRVVVHDP